jgi:hypothetical protein
LNVFDTDIEITSFTRLVEVIAIRLNSMHWDFGQFLWAERYLLSVFQIHWHKCIFSLEAEAELISADERRDYSALNAVRLLCSDDSEGILHILRKHIFRFFCPLPPFFYVLCTENKQKLPFSNPLSTPNKCLRNIWMVPRSNQCRRITWKVDRIHEVPGKNGLYNWCETQVWTLEGLG